MSKPPYTTFRQYLEEELQDPVFRALWETSRRVQTALEQYLEARTDPEVGDEPPLLLTEVERKLLAHELLEAVDQCLWRWRQGYRWRISRHRRRESHTGQTNG